MLRTFEGHKSEINDLQVFKGDLFSLSSDGVVIHWDVDVRVTVEFETDWRSDRRDCEELSDRSKELGFCSHR
jgi:hypothetical protein